MQSRPPRAANEPRAASSALAFKSDAAADIKYVFREDDEGGELRERGRPAGGAGEGQLQNRLGFDMEQISGHCSLPTHLHRKAAVIHLLKGDILSILSEIEIRRWQIVISWFKLVPSRWPSPLNLVFPGNVPGWRDAEIKPIKLQE